VKALLVIAGAGLELFGFATVAVGLLRVRSRYGIKGIHFSWMRRFLQRNSAKTRQVSHATDVALVRETTSIEKLPAWETMNQDRKLDWLRDSVLDLDIRDQNLMRGLDIERIERQDADKATITTTELEIQRLEGALADDRSESLALEEWGLFAFVLGIGLATWGGLL